MSRIEQTIRKLKSRNHGALIGYATAGAPSPKYTPKIAEAMVKGGVDILELGIPFSDPIADGPVIQQASTIALERGTTPKMVLEMAKEIKHKNSLPLVIMTYYNPVYRMGLNNFFHLATQSGIDGVIVPDLPCEEAIDYVEAGERAGIDTIFLASPATSEARLRGIANVTRGFLYLVSVFGVTGARERVATSTKNLVKRFRAVVPEVNLAVGFGISKPEHVGELFQSGADGAIIGSAFVKIMIGNHPNPQKMLSTLGEKVKLFKSATRISG